MTDNILTKVFHFDANQKSFEDFGHANNIYYWYGRDLMTFLGYESYDTFEKTAINKAIAACMTLKISVYDNFQQCKRDIDGADCSDYKLTRFACYLIAMNGDVKKSKVAEAQIYFAAIAAKRAGVENYAFFQNAGYLGMYNMSIKKLRERKKIPQRRTPLDFMGKEELAANLFRLTQTDLKIQRENIKGQKPLERAAKTVGKVVRETMIKTGGITPESMPRSEDIKKIHTDLKKNTHCF